MGLLVRRVALACWLAVAPLHAEWKMALPGWEYELPRDHGAHAGFKTEWWYFTGNLQAEDGREFGYQLTFFRQGILPPEAKGAESRFVTRDVKLAHFAVSEITDRRFHFFQKISRGAYGEAGFDKGKRLAWIEDWNCEMTGENAFRLAARAREVELNLELKAGKPVVIHGEKGLSQKAEGAGRASHYYSLTRLETEGVLRIAGKESKVSGLSWFDHEWATNQLTAEQVGWDWLSVQLEDGTELMLFQLRTKDGGRDAHSSGTFVDAKGVATTVGDFVFTPGRKWRSPQTGAEYPVEWRVEIPKLGLNLKVRAALDAQELKLEPVSYWEGAVKVEGVKANSPIKGSGYLEMTGYAGPIVGLQEP